MDILGIDISKDDFHATLIQEDKTASKAFPNSEPGFRQLRRWLVNRKCGDLHACMEATGSYWLPLALHLYEHCRVSVVNPHRIKAFSQSQLRRTKTDKVDAQIIADFCRTQQPDSWVPPAPQTLALRALLTYREHVVAEHTRCSQLRKQLRMPAALQARNEERRARLKAETAELEGEIRAHLEQHPDLAKASARLRSIPGIGLLSAATLIAELPMDRLRNAKAAVAFAGISPRDRQSGTSLRAQAHICKTGNPRIRKILYLAALSASRSNPRIVPFVQRLKAKGKASKLILVAVARKLLTIAYALLRSGACFSPLPT